MPTKQKKLTKRQLAVIEGLFQGESKGEQAVLDAHRVPRTLFEKWLGEERFTSEFERRIERAYRESRTRLAASTRAAAERLVELTKASTETARKACLDIINHRPPAAHKTASQAPTAPETPTPAPDLSPEAASRLLAGLATQA